MSVARTIIDKLSPGTIFMLGGEGSVLPIADGRGIRFAVKASPKRVNRIEIELAPTDTFTIRFQHVSFGRSTGKFKIEDLVTSTDIYVDALHSTLELHTGLAARMPRVVFGAARRA